MITDIYCSTCIQHSIHAHQFVKIISKYSWTKLHQINSECEIAGINKTTLRLQWKVTHVS